MEYGWSTVKGKQTYNSLKIQFQQQHICHKLYDKACVEKVVFSLFQIATVKGPNKRRNKMLWPSDFLLLFLCGSISTSAKHYKDQKVPKRKCHLPCHGEVVVLYNHTYGHINHTFLLETSVCFYVNVLADKRALFEDKATSFSKSRLGLVVLLPTFLYVD